MVFFGFFQRLTIPSRFALQDGAINKGDMEYAEISQYAMRHANVRRHQRFPGEVDAPQISEYFSSPPLLCFCS